MIIQNLHKKNVEKHLKKTLIGLLCKLVCVFCCFLVSGNILAQDSIPATASNDERDHINFQKHFFKAITQKAINNYQNAVDALESCNELAPNNKAVFFELSKNYHKLHRYVEAVEYANKALSIEPDNLWVLEHLVQVHRKNNAIDEAIKVQKKIAKNRPKKQQYLVYLYLQKNDKASAKALLSKLEKAKLLTPWLKRTKKRLFTIKSEPTEIVNKPSDSNVENVFNKNKTFASLKQLLTKLDTENNPKLLDYSVQGISLFPAQPLVYLMNGRANNKSKQYKKAISSLQNGIDFVIDNPTMELNFYNEFIRSYDGLGDSKNANKYRKKLK
ncbi:tetratricopeptide repeat protein [Tenacibaculum sp. 190524A02b]|uniref:tetratricopeptide repeat protein n=1 Tax=Tenacibaculum vairaonense TaxID=3137860 RepID=UPI0032B2DC21